MQISIDYFIQKFSQICSNITFNKTTKVYQARCPICGDSKKNSKKRRLHFYLQTKSVYCFNCGWSGLVFNFVKEVTKMSNKEIFEEAKDYDILPEDITVNKEQIKETRVIPTLPYDSINLFDNNQLSFYKNKDKEIIQIVLNYIKDRKINVAEFRPKTLWLSLTDVVHANRLIIPFYDFNGQIIFYQSREILPTNDDLPKYLSKVCGDKTLFNIEKLDPLFDKIFILEGPIDTMFLKNAVATTGITNKSSKLLTTTQELQLSKFFLHERIICLDSQWLDLTSYQKTYILIEEGHSVFIWPENYGKIFKDFNEMAVRLNLTSIPVDFILKNTFKGLRAKLAVSQIKCLATTDV